MQPPRLDRDLEPGGPDAGEGPLDITSCSTHTGIDQNEHYARRRVMGQRHRVRRVLSVSAGRRKVVTLSVQPREGNGSTGAGSHIEVSLLLQTGHSSGEVSRPPQ